MISSLKGRVGRIWANYVEVDVDGVGYQVQFSNKNSELSIGEDIKLFIHTAVSENDISLYGFRTVEEMNLFKMLITVSGIGPKTAAGILAEKKADDLIRAIGNADVGYFEKIKGIGKKSAQRIIVDLKSKINNQDIDISVFTTESCDSIDEDDLLLSLRQLGFEKKEIEKVSGRLPKELVTVEERLSWCLKNME